MQRADASLLVLAARANPGWRMRATRLVVSLAPMLVAGWFGLAGSTALAADAVVLSVAGTATAEGAPAAPGLRTLRNGSELFEGDLVRTGDDGRVQFRFTDGGLVSLQPRTAFRIDEYRHGGATQRSFFSLLRGALRTATGAIGRRDRDDYRLRTPTATVGIRGTEFLAEETVCDPRCTPGPSAGLRVSVTQGRIAVSTGAGSIEVGQGQSAVVDGPGALPRLTAAGPVLAPRALADAGQSPGTGDAGGRSSSAAPATDSSAPVPGTTDATASGGAATGTTDSIGGQTAGSPFRLAERKPSDAGGEPASTAAGSASPKTVQGAPADGDWPADRAQPITVALVPTVPGLPLAPPPAGDAISPNNERGPDGELSAVTDALPDDLGPGDPGDGGAPGPGDPGSGDPGSGDPGPGDPGPGDPGSGDPGSGDPGSGDPGSGDPGSGDPGSGDPGSGDPGSGDPGSGDPGSGDPGSGDPGSGDPGSGDPGPGDPGPGDPGSGDPGPGDPGSGDPDIPPPMSGPGVIVKTGQLYLRNLPPVFVVFDWLPLTNIGGRYVLDEQGRLQSLGLDDSGSCTLMICLSRGDARLAEAQADAHASWGRWTDGTIASHGALGWAVLAPSRRLSANQGLHYLVGVPSTTVPTSGQFGYALLGATKPTFDNGSASPGSFTGSAAVAFSPGQARIGLEGLVTIGGNSYSFATIGGARDPSTSALATDAGSNFAFRGGPGALGCAGGSGCTIDVSGGLFGPDAARLGLSYEIAPVGRGSTISGVGVFQKQ